MNTMEAFTSALSNLSAHKLRSILTMLGMIFGVGAVIAMLSIGAGAERQSMEMIERMGLRNILVQDKDLNDQELSEIRKKSLGVSIRDAEAILEGVPGVLDVVPKVDLKPYKIHAPGASTEAQVFGVSDRYDRIVHLPLQEGRFLDPLDSREHAQVCVIGPGVRRDLFGFGEAVGKLLKINDVWFRVVGVLADSGESTEFQGVDLGTTATEIYLPATTAMRKFDREPMQSPVDELLCRLDQGVSSAAAAVTIRAMLKRIHGGEDDFELVVPEALLEQSRRTQRLFNIVMGCIAGISLLVGGIGIMNIMLATVLERTREIGVRRAVGARRNDILTQFIVESFTISTLGGVAGVVAGVLIAGSVAMFAGWETVVTAPSVLLATGVSVAVGLVSGIYPAIRASRLDPIEALRYE